MNERCKEYDKSITWNLKKVYNECEARKIKTTNVNNNNKNNRSNKNNKHIGMTNNQENRDEMNLTSKNKNK